MSYPAVIESARLTARPIAEDDGPAIFSSYASDPEVTRFLSWTTNQKPSESMHYARQAVAQWELGNERVYVASLKGSNELIGGGRIAQFRPGTYFHLEIGFCLGKKFWRQGLGSELAASMLDLALSQPETRRVSAVVNCMNEVSCRVLEKIGMKREAKLERGSVHPNLSLEPVDVFIYVKLKE